MTCRYASRFLLLACSLYGMNIVLGASAGVPQAPSSSAPTFARDVLPILQKNCQSCHRPGQIGPMPLLTYEQARPWARGIRTKIENHQMPPWSADPETSKLLSNNRALTHVEIGTIAAWVDAGAPEGDPKDAPAPVAWPADGWLIQPDTVVSLPEYAVPAKAIVEWENLAIPSPFKTDTWITSLEILPGQASVVHHICLQFQKHREDVVYNQYEWMEVPRDAQGVAIRQTSAPSGENQNAQNQLSARGTGEGWVLTRDAGSGEVHRRWGRPTITAPGTFCYVPGMSVHDFRSFSAGKLVPAGSDIILNIHYNPTGKAVVDRTRIGMTVAKQAPGKQYVEIVASGAGPTFAIPPNDSNWKAPDVDITIKHDVDLVWMWPHMHLRGKDMKYTLIYPDGRRQVVLNVPHYDFNWQLGYFPDPIHLPSGTIVHVEAHYDNSPANRFNPNPNTWVYPGNQTWEEMYGAIFAVVAPKGVDERSLTSRFQVLPGA